MSDITKVEKVKPVIKYGVKTGTVVVEYDSLTIAAYEALKSDSTPGRRLIKFRDGKEVKFTKPESGVIGRRQYINDFIKRWDIKPGRLVYTSLRSVARSGMSRCIRLYIASSEAGGPLVHDITYDVAQILQHSMKDSSLIVGGCGMDMGFAVVYNLGQVLWPKGTPAPHSTRNGEPDTDGGYALKQSWL